MSSRTATQKYRHSPTGKATAKRYRKSETGKASIRATLLRRQLKYRALLDHLKDGPCADCKNTFPPVCMDFDHVRGEKVGQLSRMVRKYGAGALENEIAKCELVCANCHRIRTQKRREGLL